MAKAAGTTMANNFPAIEMVPTYFLLRKPKVWKADAKPCHK